MITVDRLKHLLHYEPKTGIFTWNKPRKSKPDGIAGHLTKGYTMLNIDRRSYSAHRLAFLYMNGEFPTHYVDHVDGNKSNNSWENLRPATQSQNQFNARVNSKSKTGMKGAYLQKNSGLYVSRTVFEGKRVSLGCFKTAEEAKAAYNNFHIKNNNSFFRP